MGFRFLARSRPLLAHAMMPRSERIEAMQQRDPLSPNGEVPEADSAQTSLSRRLVLLLVLIGVGAYVGSSMVEQAKHEALEKQDRDALANRWEWGQRECPIAQEQFASFEELSAMLDDVQVLELDAAFAFSQQAFEKSSFCDPMMNWTAVALAGYVAESGSEQNARFSTIDLWIEAVPDSAFPYAIRGGAWVDIAFDRRGNRLSKDTSKEQFAGMRDAFVRAKADLEKAIELDPKNLAAYLNYMRYSRANDVRHAAPAILDRALDAGVVSQRLFWRYFEAAGPEWGATLETIDHGVAKARPLISSDRRLSKVLGARYHFMAQKHMRKEEYKQASDLWQSALRYADDCKWYYLRGNALRLQRHNTAAVKEFDKALEGCGEYFAASLARGKSNLYMGENEEAIEDFSRALAIDAKHRRALTGRAEAHERLGRYEEAVSDYRAGAELTSKPSAWHLGRLGEVLYYDLQRYSEALPVYARMVELYPTNPNGWHRYGMTLHRLGRGEAREVLEHYLALADPTDEAHASKVAEARSTLGIAKRIKARSRGTLPGLSGMGTKVDS